MANFSAQGPIVLHGTPLDSGGDTVQRYPLGTKATDLNQAEWIYLQGVASNVAGAWVSYDEAHVTALLAANAKGRVAVSGAAVVAGDFGWFQIWGHCTSARSLDVADNGSPLFASGTAGHVDDAAVQGDRIYGAFARSADDTSDTAVVGSIDAELSYPVITDASGDTAVPG